MVRLNGLVKRYEMVSVALVLALGAATTGCSGEAPDGSEDYIDGNDSLDPAGLSSDDATDDGEAMELGTSQQALFFNPFKFTSSCSDSKGTNSVMAALAVAAATELHRWQPTKDFQTSNGVLKLTTTGQAQCADKKCWNTQAILDLQNAPAGTVQIHPGVMLDSRALKSALSSNLTQQIFNLISNIVPEHSLQLMYSEPGGCDQLYWFNVTKPSGGLISSLLASTLDEKLEWVGGKDNPYVQFQTNGSMVGVDPTYGLNEAGSSAPGACTAACTKMSSSDVAGACCSCNGTKKFVRSLWSATTYICQ